MSSFLEYKEDFGEFIEMFAAGKSMLADLAARNPEFFGEAAGHCIFLCGWQGERTDVTHLPFSVPCRAPFVFPLAALPSSD